MNRCMKIECFTTLYSNNSQSVTDGKRVSSGTDASTIKFKIVCTLLLEVGMLGTAKHREKRITKAIYE